MSIGDDTWPVWAREPVTLMPFDLSWKDAADTECTALRTVFGSAAIHHIGSTAIAGLPAKPILDFMAASDVLDAAGGNIATLENAASEQLDANLAALGYERVPPQLDAREWRRFYVKPREQRRYAHLHVVMSSHPRWRDALLFRDFLRSQNGAREAYAALKQRLAQQHEHDREAYSAGKSGFVATILARARQRFG